MEKILLDTDIGSDIDDAVCLSYLLANPECKLLGITTVTGEANLRAQMASALCRVAGQDIPIYPGIENPLLVEQKQKIARQAAALSHWPHQEKFPGGEAIEFLRRTIHQNPGEISLLTIGPLTNIALLFASDPEIPGLLKRLVMMCGIFTPRVAGAGPREWNALVDPHATAIVYRSPVGVHPPGDHAGRPGAPKVSASPPETGARFCGNLVSGNQPDHLSRSAGSHNDLQPGYLCF